MTADAMVRSNLSNGPQGPQWDNEAMSAVAQPRHPASFATVGIVEGPATRMSEEGETIHFTAARVALQYADGGVSYHFHRFSGSWGAEQLMGRIRAAQGAAGFQVRTDVLDATCWSQA